MSEKPKGLKRLVPFYRAKKFIWSRLKKSNFSGLPDKTIEEFQQAIEEYADFLVARLGEAKYSRPSPADVDFAVKEYQKDCVRRFVRNYKSLIFLREGLKEVENAENEGG